MTPEPARLELPAFRRLAPETERALLAISTATNQSALGAELITLIKLRASLMNGCAFCIQMHGSEARKLRVSGERIEALRHWRESSLFTPREGAALAWTEALTHLEGGDVSDDVFREVSAAFSESEHAALTSVVVTINAWNRIAMAYRFPSTPGTGGRE